ncbi:hypothetical protein ACKE5C_19025 (plasmid) [Aneurinibacillus thermoaerophilus]|uniref:Uncharacterized protein n=1 Tax=Aneurinibacillus thermoaerophilus TaxID=143495 RepID=A0ABX8YHF1_ANETH|nr:hypothetical protein [Aneurinibacillus thermoaerophilus]QYY44800.1 hypothetical protein K3F53_18875 [Aneurinibacillus thermoaerophilus]
MLTIQNTVLLSDVLKLPKQTLKDICTDLDLPNDGLAGDLSERIWVKISKDRVLQNLGLKNCKDKLLAGRTSVTWYSIEGTETLDGMKELIIENNDFNPFEKVVIPPRDTLTSTPILISGAQGEEEGEYYLRFMYKSGVIRDIYGEEMTTRPKSSVGNVYINEKKNCIEIRTEPKVAERIAGSLASLIRQQISLSETVIMAPYGSDVELLADDLKGELIDAVAKPELFVEEFTQDQGEAVVGILSALDTFFEDEDINKLQIGLLDAKQRFGDDLLTVPFTAIILAGMEKVGMGVTGRDLRGLPLYDSLRPYLQHQGGFIRFEIKEDGVMKPYTIRVGLTTNSIVFLTPATESAIRYVRDNVIVR